jgi:hypothetical protein
MPTPQEKREEFWARIREKKRQGWMNYGDWERQYGRSMAPYARRGAYQEFLKTTGKPTPTRLPSGPPFTPTRMQRPGPPFTPTPMPFTKKTPTPLNVFTPKIPVPMPFTPRTPNIMPGRPGNIQPNRLLRPAQRQDFFTNYLTQKRPTRMASTVGWGG